MRYIVSGRTIDKSAASTNEMGRFETEMLSQRENVKYMLKNAVHITERVKKYYDRRASTDLTQVSLKKWKLVANEFTPYLKTTGKVLFPGCGMGEVIISIAKQKPLFEYYGIDLSKNALEIARQSAIENKVNVDFKQGDYTESFPWPFKFEYIYLLDTLHHAADPQLALNNIVHYLENKGLIYIHLYGKKRHRRRFEIIEILNILQSVTGNDNLQERFDLFAAHENKKNSFKDRIMDFSLRQMWRALLQMYLRLKHQYMKNIFSPDGTYNEFSPVWIDFYCHPRESTFDILQTKELLTQAGLELIEIQSISIDPTILPESWRPLFEKLDLWSQYRLLELYDYQGPSIKLLARRAT